MLRALLAACTALPLSGCSAPDVGGLDAGLDAAPEAAVPMDAEAGACALARPYSTKNATCNACAEARCCVEVNGCLLDPDCDDGYVNCAIACALDPDAGAGSTPCLADCATQYPQGESEYDAAIGCVDQRCAVECQ
jgi:hypothetical protein